MSWAAIRGGRRRWAFAGLAAAIAIGLGSGEGGGAEVRPVRKAELLAQETGMPREAPSPAEPLEVDFIIGGDPGLSELRLRGSGHNWTAPHEAAVGVQTFRQKNGDGRLAQAPHPWCVAGPSQVRGPVYERQLAWGRSAITYRAQGNRLGITVTTSNALEEEIHEVLHYLGYIELPVAAREIPWSFPRIDRHLWPLFPIVAGDVVVFFSSLDIGDDVFELYLTEERHRLRLVLKMEGLAPGESASRTITLSFARGDEFSFGLIDDVVEEMRRRDPPALRWPDRRPIAALFPNVGFSVDPICDPVKNPNGWIFGGQDKVDISSAEGRRRLRADALDWADRCIENMRVADCQGAIVWSIEGLKLPHAISYIGSPAHGPELAPEMKDIVAPFFRRFADAGFRTGLTIRPQRFERDDGRWGYRQAAVPDPGEQVEVLAEKIRYAREEYGCTIFYIDSNVSRIPRGSESVEVVDSAGVCRSLLERFPDVLLIPEHETIVHYAVAAPLEEETPRFARYLYPGAFSVDLFFDADRPDWEEERRDLEAGDILIVPNASWNRDHAALVGELCRWYTPPALRGALNPPRSEGKR